MFIRKTKSRNSICFQIGKKQCGKFLLVQHVGCANTLEEIEALQIKAQTELTRLLFENQLSLFPEQNKPIPLKEPGERDKNTPCRSSDPRKAHP